MAGQKIARWQNRESQGPLNGLLEWQRAEGIEPAATDAPVSQESLKDKAPSDGPS